MATHTCLNSITNIVTRHTKISHTSHTNIATRHTQISHTNITQAQLNAKTVAAPRLLEGGGSASSLPTSTQTSFENSPKSLCCLAVDTLFLLMLMLMLMLMLATRYFPTVASLPGLCGGTSSCSSCACLRLKNACRQTDRSTSHSLMKVYECCKWCPMLQLLSLFPHNRAFVILSLSCHISTMVDIFQV